MMSEAGHLDAFTRLSEIATSLCPLQVENCTYMLYSRKDTRVDDAHLQTLLSKMQKRTQNVATCEEICSSLLSPCQAVMNKTQASQSWLIYGNMHIWTTSHAGNQLSMDGNFSHCDQMPQEVFCEDDGSPNDDNDTDNEHKTPSMDESE